MKSEPAGNTRIRRRLGAASVAACLLALGAVAASSAGGKEPAEISLLAGEPTFHADIYPILKAKCIRCHNPRKKDGKLDMESLETMLKGGVSGPPFTPGDSKQSLMVDMIFFNEMPPKKAEPKVSKEELKLIEQWIDAGAPAGEKDS